MKQVGKFMLAGAVIMASLSSSAFADQQPKSNGNDKRQTSKPSIFQTWRDETRSLFQGIIDWSKYIQGNGPPRYN